MGASGELVPNSAPKHIAIVGGGFSGVMTAVNLARLSTHPLQVTVINDRRPAGRGVAYNTRRPQHLLNVAARNMSAFRDDPDHFLRWLRARSEFDTLPEIELRERFIPRMVYGDWLQAQGDPRGLCDNGAGGEMGRAAHPGRVVSAAQARSDVPPAWLADVSRGDRPPARRAGR